MPGPISELITTTLRNRSGKLADNVTKNNALLNRISTRGNMKMWSGGRTLFHELEYAENATFRRYSGYDLLNITPSDVMTAAEFDPKQAAVAVTMSGLEGLQNAGKEQMIDMLESRIKNAERTMRNNMSSDAYSDGTADGGKQMGGLALLVPDDPTTGTAGGISRVTYPFWRSQLYDFSVESVTASATTIQAAMNTLYLRCSRGNDHPDLIIFDNIFYGYYWASLQAIQRITSADTSKVGAGFESLRFMGADVVYDGGQGGFAPSSHGYFLNSDYIYYRPHRERNMVPLDPARYATNQDALIKIIGWCGNMTAGNLALQGVMTL